MLYLLWKKSFYCDCLAPPNRGLCFFGHTQGSSPSGPLHRLRIQCGIHPTCCSLCVNDVTVVWNAVGDCFAGPSGWRRSKTHLKIEVDTQTNTAVYGVLNWSSSFIFRYSIYHRFRIASFSTYVTSNLWPPPSSQHGASTTAALQQVWCSRSNERPTGDRQLHLTAHKATKKPALAYAQMYSPILDTTSDK